MSSCLWNIPFQKPQGGLLQQLVFLDKEQGGRGGVQGAGRAHGRQLPILPPPKLDGSGCGVAGIALQGPHPGPELGVHSQQAHEGQGGEPHTEADVQVGEVPFQHLQPLAPALPGPGLWLPVRDAGQLLGAAAHSPQL